MIIIKSINYFNDNACFNRLTQTYLLGQLLVYCVETKMLTKIKITNFFFYFPLNLLFTVGKLQGLIVFAYETVPVMSYRISPFLTTYSNVYTMLIVIVLQTLVIKILYWLQHFQLISKIILIFVFTTETMITAYRVIVVYILQFCYRKQFKSILSEAFHIHQTLDMLMNGVLIYDKDFYRCYISKVVGVMFQWGVIFFLITQYKRFITDVFYSDIVSFLAVSYMHFTTITISSIFYAGMMFILLFYQNLNEKSIRITDTIKTLGNTDLEFKVKHRLHCRLTDEIDKIVHMYDKISALSKKFNKFYSLQLLLTIGNAFYMILVQVVTTKC